MDSTELLRPVVRHKLVAIFTAALVLTAAALFVVVQPRVYESSASVALLPATRSPDTLAAYDTIVTRLLPLYATKVRSRSFLDRVATRSGERLDGKDLEGMVFAAPDPGAAVLKLVARADNPQRAARLAEATTAQLLFELRDTLVVTFEVIDQPRVPETPVAPRPELVLPASLLLAAFLAVAAAVAWERLFGRIRNLDELRLASGKRVLGALPYQRLLRRSSSSPFVGDPTMAVAEESLRNVRTFLLGPGRASPTFQTITLTSLNPGDGKSTLTANLAVLLAEVGLHVLVVDADAHRPRQHEIFDLANERGLSTAVDVKTVAQPSRFAKVSVLTAGPPLQRRSEIVELYVHVLPKLGELADVVLIDSPPLSGDADVGLLAAMTDGVVVLVRAGSTSTVQLRRALERLEAVGVPVLGLILTMSSKRAAAAYAPYGYPKRPATRGLVRRRRRTRLRPTALTGSDEGPRGSGTA